jgi:hypothetical protein
LTVEEAKARLRSAASGDFKAALLKGGLYPKLGAAFIVGILAGYSPQARKTVAKILQELLV